MPLRCLPRARAHAASPLPPPCAQLYVDARGGDAAVSWSGAAGLLRQHTWVLWSTLYYMRFTFALLSFPYLICLLPGIADVLIRAGPTGYDERGMLCPALSHAEIQSRWLIEKAAQREKGGAALHEEERI